jgi:two-component system heavy metal sensor histidine kinase CusS
MKPVARISETAGRIRSTTLASAAGGEFPAELDLLARTFNEMLDRLQESFDRISRFSADIAHELRTPLSNLRGEVEVTLGKARSPEEYRETSAPFSRRRRGSRGSSRVSSSWPGRNIRRPRSSGSGSM